MNEFYSPLRPSENEGSSADVMYDEKPDINIVVDNGGAQCRYCGYTMGVNDVVCPNCNSPLDPDQMPQSAQQAQQTNQPFMTQQMQQTYNYGANKITPPYQSGKNAFDNRTMGAQFGQAPTIINNNYYNNSNNINTNMMNMSAPPGTKNKTVALILCILFGWCGAHRYYEGKIATGILWTLTAGLGGIGWLIDFLILLFKPKWYNP